MATLMAAVEKVDVEKRTRKRPAGQSSERDVKLPPKKQPHPVALEAAGEVGPSELPDKRRRNLSSLFGQCMLTLFC